MWRFLSPLKIFIVGMILVLITTVFFPAIDSTSTSTSSAIASYSGSYWGISNILSSSKLIVFIVGLGAVLFFAAMAWLKRK